MKGKIFNSEEVQAIIAGKKTMFREVIKPQPTSNINPINLKEIAVWQWATKVGQEIFVKEPFNVFCAQLVYKFSYEKRGRVFWMPASRMKQGHSRITLRIKNVKVERLQDTSEEDCIKEGFKTDYKILPNGIFKKDAIKFFIEDWNLTHKKPKEEWEANPFVFVYEFEIINLDK